MCCRCSAVQPSPAIKRRTLHAMKCFRPLRCAQCPSCLSSVPPARLCPPSTPRSLSSQVAHALSRARHRACAHNRKPRHLTYTHNSCAWLYLLSLRRRVLSRRRHGQRRCVQALRPRVILPTTVQQPSARRTWTTMRYTTWSGCCPATSPCLCTSRAERGNRCAWQWLRVARVTCG